MSITFPYILARDKKSKRCLALTSDLQQLLTAAAQQHRDTPIWPSCYDRDAPTIRYRPANLVLYARRHGLHCASSRTGSHHACSAVAASPERWVFCTFAWRVHNSAAPEKLHTWTRMILLHRASSRTGSHPACPPQQHDECTWIGVILASSPRAGCFSMNHTANHYS